MASFILCLTDAMFDAISTSMSASEDVDADIAKIEGFSGRDETADGASCERSAGRRVLDGIEE
jgi:hypothetical protein